MPVADFLQPSWRVKQAVKNLLVHEKTILKSWDDQVTLAAKSADQSQGTSTDRYVLNLYEKWRASSEDERRDRSVRIPQRSGEVFVSAHASSPAAKGLQADLNAAANIGLKALLDPDWEGAWWYVLCDPKTFVPIAKNTKGSVVIDSKRPLKKPADDEQSGDQKSRRKISKSASDRPVNLWRDVCHLPLIEEEWRVYAAYQNFVQYRVVQVLRAQAGLDGVSLKSTSDSKEDVPF